MIAATLTRMRLTVWSRTPNSLRGLGVLAGTALAVGTLAVAVFELGGAGSTSDLLAVAFAGWLLGWVIGPVQGGGNDFLRAEWFSTLPARRRSLTTGMFAASCVGIGPLLSLVAFLGLLAYSLRLGPVAVLVAVPAVVVQVALVVAVSKLVSEAIGGAARSRIATELAAMQYGLVVTFSMVGWVLVWGAFSIADETGASFADLLPSAMVTGLRVLPTGWGLVAVEAAGAGAWLVSLVALLGLVAVTALLVLAWARLLERRMTGGRSGTSSRPRARVDAAPRRRILPPSAIGAVAGKDLRSWWRDPRRGIELRTAVWACVFTTVVLWLADIPAALPFTGAIVVLLGGVTCVNVYAMDGTALWHTLLTPGAERADVRGRQLAWLAIFAPLAVAGSLVGLLVGGAPWSLPWVLGLVPALLGGAAGLIPMLSVLGLAPETDAHKRSGNPAETGGDANGLYLLMVFLVPVTALPTGLLLWAAGSRPGPLWLAALSGPVTGLACAWGLGRIAYRRLQTRGPELLQLMRVGPTVQRADRRRTSSLATAGMSWREKTVMYATGIVAMPALFPFGLVPTVFTLVGEPWWLYEAVPVLGTFRWPLQIAMVTLALGILWAGWRVHVRTKARARA